MIDVVRFLQDPLYFAGKFHDYEDIKKTRAPIRATYRPNGFKKLEFKTIFDRFFVEKRTIINLISLLAVL